MVQEAEEPLKMPYLLRLQKSNIYGILYNNVSSIENGIKYEQDAYGEQGWQ